MVSLKEPATKADRMGQASWALVFLAMVVVAYFLRPSPNGHGTHTQLGLPPCPSVLLFSRPCPGCGMTTCFAYMAQGQVLEAFRVHALGPILFLAWAASALAAGYGALRGRKLDTSSRAFNWAMALFAVAFFIYGGVRFQQGFSSDPLVNLSVERAAAK
jgi:hypothetical protein